MGEAGHIGVDAGADLVVASGGVAGDVVAGLTNLGYPEPEARQVAAEVLEAEPDLDVAAALRQALKRLAAAKQS